MPLFPLLQVCIAYRESIFREPLAVPLRVFSEKYLTRGDNVGMQVIMMPMAFSTMDQMIDFEESR